MTEALALQLGTALGAAFRIERELGGGGMSRVFLATETALDRRVVIKVLPPELEGAVSTERFRREMLLAAQLQHPLIVPLLAAGVAGDLLYFTMPFVEGTSLRAELDRGSALPLPQVVRILRDVLEALSYAHEQGVVHRDIKPDNVLLARHHAVVTDFGVAKALSLAGGGNFKTTVGLVIGSPPYMAPEQAAGDPATDHRVDVYATGVMAYEMLTGATPFHGRLPSQLLAAHLVEKPDPLETRRPDVPRALSALVMRMLEKNPADRPQSADQALTVLAEIGTPSGPSAPTRSSSAWRNGALALATVALTVMAALGIARWRGKSAPAGERRAPSLAVLPFADLSPARDNEYFSDGMSEELIGALSRVPGLRVVGRSSSFAFKGQNPDVREVGRKLDVGAVLEGTVRKSGNTLRVTAQLIDAASGFSLWSNTYDRDLHNIFALQDELSGAIVAALRDRLAGATAPAAPAPTADVEAYNDYLQGRYFWNRRDPESLRRALDFFARAIKRDARYAQAYAGVADVYNVQGGLSFERPLVVFPRAKEAAIKALALNPNLAEAHAALGFVHLFSDWDGLGARQEFERAFVLDPNYATAHMYCSFYFVAVAQLDSALAQMERARDLDPLSLIINFRLGDALYGLHRFDDAIAQYRHTADLDSTFAPLKGAVPYVMVLKGDLAGALREFAALDKPGHPWVSGDRVIAYVRSGFADSARVTFERLKRIPNVEAFGSTQMAYAWMALGVPDSAFAALDRGAKQRHVGVTTIPEDPMFEPLHGDPRYGALLRRMGFAR